MKLAPKDRWTNFITAAGIPPDKSAHYKFVNNCLIESTLQDPQKKMGIAQSFIIYAVISFLIHLLTPYYYILQLIKVLFLLLYYF